MTNPIIGLPLAGDKSNIWLPLLLIAAAIITIVVVIILNTKRNK